MRTVEEINAKIADHPDANPEDCAWVEALTWVLEPTSVDNIMSEASIMVLTKDADALVGVVMMLTGGSANPFVVRAQIERARKNIPGA